MAANSWQPITITQDYKERVRYDANGNILSYLRNGAAAVKGLSMDDLSYVYNRDASGNLINNRLRHVKDAASSAYTEDLKSQPDDNYSYDDIGNLTKDVSGGIKSITWNVYGKIQSIEKTPAAGNDITRIDYQYDPTGNRITKAVTRASGNNEYTAYVRDAQGNVMAIYQVNSTAVNKGTLNLTEQHLYGSSRLGIYQRKVDVDKGFEQKNAPYIGAVTSLTVDRGNKQYELGNHLGNVLVTVSDKKIAVPSASRPLLVDHFEAEVVSAQDYCPFGMQMVGRHFAGGSDRFGFNGKENDHEVNGPGNEINFGARVYDPRLGRFLSVDPLTKVYMSLSPYVFSGDNPVLFIDNQGKGPELPPSYVTRALLLNDPVGTYALVTSVNTSPNELYKWVAKTSNDPTAYFKLKGAFGEAEAFARIISDFTAVRGWLGAPPAASTKIAARYNGLQVDVQSTLRSYTQEGGIWNTRHAVGIRNYSFDGKENELAIFGKSIDATYTINYEIKTLSPKNDVGFNFRKLAEGIQQTLERSKGEYTIGVLVTDKETWLNVANDAIYGPQLKNLYNMMAKAGTGAYLRLEANLNTDAHKRLMKAKQTVKQAVDQHNSQNHSNN